MELTTQLQILKIVVFILVVLWAWQAFVLGRVTKALKTATAVIHSQSLICEEYKLAKAMLDQNKITQATTKELVDCLTTMNDRTSAYNERLNQLTAAVRIKVSRIDNQYG